MNIRKALVSLVLIACATSALAQEAVTRTIIAPDKSGSSTFLYEEASADAMAQYAHDYIAGLTPPHSLLVLAVGDEGLAARDIQVRAEITNRRSGRPDRIAPQIAQILGSLPSLVKSGQLEADDTTSLVAFFNALEPVCAEMPTRVILFTDGVEWSAQTDGRAFLQGQADLPAPTRPFLSGCHVEMHGIGQLKADMDSSGLEARLIPIWRDWLTAAGASSVRVTGSFFIF